MILHCRLTLAKLGHYDHRQHARGENRLSELVKAVETTGETVILCRNGTEVAEIHPIKPRKSPKIDRLKPHPELKVTFAPGYDPTEP